MKIKLDNYENFLGENDYSFLQRVYAEGLEKYIYRLKAIGFEGFDLVVDAGCGFGQWSFALSQLNKVVYSYDFAPERVLIANDLAQKNNVNNVSFIKSSLEDSKLSDQSCDAIFCFGTIFITDVKASLKEFFRILKPQGVIYLNANAIGWALNSWFNSPNMTKDHDPRQNVYKMFKNTILYQNGLGKEDGQIIIEKDEMVSWMKEVGFSIDSIGAEGSLIKNSDYEPKPFFKSEYFGFDGVFEILARKA